MGTLFMARNVGNKKCFLGEELVKIRALMISVLEELAKVQATRAKTTTTKTRQTTRWPKTTTTKTTRATTPTTKGRTESKKNNRGPGEHTKIFRLRKFIDDNNLLVTKNTGGHHARTLKCIREDIISALPYMAQQPDMDTTIVNIFRADEIPVSVLLSMTQKSTVSLKDDNVFLASVANLLNLLVLVPPARCAPQDPGCNKLAVKTERELRRMCRRRKIAKNVQAARFANMSKEELLELLL